MKRLGHYQRRCFENPADNLLGLFAYFSRALPTGSIIKDADNNYSLTLHSLRADYSAQFLANGKTETLGIRKIWPGSKCRESIVIRDEYIDDKEWIVDEVLGSLSDINDEARDMIQKFKAAKTPAGLPEYLHAFAMDLCGMYFRIQTSKIEYRTDSIARGLQSFASLGIPEMPQHSGEAHMRQIYDEMLRDEEVAMEIRRILGAVNDKRRREFFRLGKLKVAKPFRYAKESSKNDCIWWDSKVEIVSLVEYFAGCGPSLEPRDGGKP